MPTAESLRMIVSLASEGGKVNTPGQGDRRWTIAIRAPVALTLLVCALPPATALASAPAVVARPVVFSVHNSNRSAVACSTDGAGYSIRGFLVRPAGSLDRSGGGHPLSAWSRVR